MCEVLRSNFDDTLPSIEQAIHESSFIDVMIRLQSKGTEATLRYFSSLTQSSGTEAEAVDSEFTGLKASEANRPSLFDNGEDRYKKLKESITQFTMCQIGISCFTKCKDSNRYVAKTFNFFLLPCSFGPVDVRFLIQTSSLHFLCKHNFSFDKFVYEGISFINNDQEQVLQQNLVSDDLFSGLDRDVDEWELQEYSSQVADWVVNAKEGDSTTLTISNDISEYIVQNELRQRFKDVWTSLDSEGNKILVKKVGPADREILRASDKEEQEKKKMDELLGFTQVFRLMAESKKPLIGHNCMMDLMLMYDKFHKPLPDRYKEFKQELHTLFPCIYDTKHMTNKLRRPFEESGLLNATNLESLFLNLDSKKGKFYVLHSPSIRHHEDHQRYTTLHCPHEAGYDAFLAGYVFLRVAHLVAMEGISSVDAEPFDTFREYLVTTKPFRNCINVIRAAVNHVSLDGQDPASVRPEWLFVRSKVFSSPLCTNQLARMMSAYGSVDIRLQDRRHALVAVGNYGCAKDILRSFRNHRDIHVSKYNMWKHSPVVRKALWVGVAFSGGLCAWALWSGRQKS